MQEHYVEHLEVIPEGQGAASGQYTWRCERCGPAGTKWPTTGGATAGLMLHLHERHSVPL